MLIDGPPEEESGADATLPPERIRALVEGAISRFDVRGRRVLVVVPDRTRTGPLAALRALVSAALDRAGAAAVTYLVALGTHRPLQPEELAAHLGVRVGAGGRTADGEVVLNHDFADPAALVRVGAVSGALLAELSGGFFRDAIAVRVNRAVVEHDLAIVCGPVFPHEVVGFSGGNKYFFPGVSGAEMIDVSHWIGALVTARALIGRLGRSPVRALIDEAARQLPIERRCLAYVVAPGATPTPDAAGALLGLFAGTCEGAWESAAALSAKVHVRRVPRPFARVVSVIPERYEDLWTAGKGMYKVEPAVADGGEVVIYAPHLREISAVHGEGIARVGYHCRDYVLGNWRRFRDVPLAVLAHATHVRGQGRYDVATAVEEPRVAVVLASGISPEHCAAVNLGYRDPATIDLAACAADPDTLLVPEAGEHLYRLAGESEHLPPLSTLLADVPPAVG